MRGADLIKEERKEQIFKHGYTLTSDSKYKNKQLKEAAIAVIDKEPEYWPEGWNTKVFNHIKKKSYLKRLIIAGAFIAAEIDRLQNKNKI